MSSISIVAYFLNNNLHDKRKRKAYIDSGGRPYPVADVEDVAAVLLAVFFFIIIWRDITKSNHYRRELEKAKQKAEHLLEQREQLMLTITHDIKAPVGSLIGYADLLKTGDSKQQTYIDSMKASAGHLLDMVTSLLDYHRLDANKMYVNIRSFSPHRLFASIYACFLPLAKGKQLTLDYQCDGAG